MKYFNETYKNRTVKKQFSSESNHIASFSKYSKATTFHIFNFRVEVNIKLPDLKGAEKRQKLWLIAKLSIPHNCLQQEVSQFRPSNVMRYSKQKTLFADVYHNIGLELGPKHTGEQIPEDMDLFQTQPGLYPRLDNLLQEMAGLRFKKLKESIYLPSDLQSLDNAIVEKFLSLYKKRTGKNLNTINNCPVDTHEDRAVLHSVFKDLYTKNVEGDLMFSRLRSLTKSEMLMNVIIFDEKFSLIQPGVRFDEDELDLSKDPVDLSVAAYFNAKSYYRNERLIVPEEANFPEMVQFQNANSFFLEESHDESLSHPEDKVSEECPTIAAALTECLTNSTLNSHLFNDQVNAGLFYNTPRRDN